MLGGHSAVIMIEGVTGCVALDGVTPVDATDDKKKGSDELILVRSELKKLREDMAIMRTELSSLRDGVVSLRNTRQSIVADSLPISLDLFARITGLSDSTIWRYRNKGWVKCYNIAGRMFMAKEDVEEFIRRMKAGEFAGEPTGCAAKSKALKEATEGSQG